MTVPDVSVFEAMSCADLVRRYRRGVENYDRRTFTLNAEQFNMAFLPDAAVGRWPVRVLLGHVTDGELAFVHRMRRAFAEENPVLAVWDEDAFIDANIYGNPDEERGLTPEAAQARVHHVAGGFVATLHTLRQWHGGWLETLTDEQFQRRAMHPERGAQTIKRILAYATWHVEHHARFLRLKLDRMLGPDVAPKAGGCCGGSCACSGQ